MPTNLYTAINYKTPIKYFLNTYIREYDLSKANISSLYYMNRISKEVYDSFFEMERNQREITIGKWIKQDPSVYDAIKTGIIEAKRQLVYANGLEDLDIVSIKNDAIFVIGKQLSITEFPPFIFKEKNTYTVYLQLQDLEVYYADFLDPNGNLNITCDIKGISDTVLATHQGGMFDLICEVCYRLQRENIKDTLKWLSDIYNLFINRKLPYQYYRNFDSESYYGLNTFMRKTSIPDINDSMIEYVDINRNLSILRDLLAIISMIYQSKIKNK